MQLSTKDRILDSAAKLFAQQGFDATSLRDITSDAQVNLAAVNYHFGSKEDLFCAVYQRLIGPLSERRRELLDGLEASGTLTLENVLDAFFRPGFEIVQRHGGIHAPFLPLLGRMFIERQDLLERIVREYLLPVGERYFAAIEKLLPGVDPTEVRWRVHFAIGAMAHTLAAGKVLMVLTQGQADPADVDGVVARLVSFSAAGLRAAVPEKCHA